MTIFFTPPPGRPHDVFRRFLSISGGWKLLCKEFIVAEDSPCVTIQHMTTCSLCVLAGVSAMCQCPSQGGCSLFTWVFLLHIYRGRGPLKNTMDVIGAAKKISEVGSNLDKLANSIADEVGGVLFTVLCVFMVLCVCKHA